MNENKNINIFLIVMVVIMAIALIFTMVKIEKLDNRVDVVEDVIVQQMDLNTITAEIFENIQEQFRLILRIV